MKPYQGRLDNWTIVLCEEATKEHLGYIVVGTSKGGRPEWEGKLIRTSLVVRREMLCVETLNSRYELGRPKIVRTSYRPHSRSMRL